MAEVDKSKNTGRNQAASKKKLPVHLDPSQGEKTQWKPGQSGNPAGKPKGTKHINTWIQEIMTDEEFQTTLLDPRQGLIDYKGAPLKAILESLARIALSHPDYETRLKAMDKIFKYGWPTKNEHTGKDGERLVQAPLVISSIQPRPTDEAGDAEAQTEAS